MVISTLRVGDIMLRKFGIRRKCKVGGRCKVGDRRICDFEVDRKTSIRCRGRRLGVPLQYNKKLHYYR